MSRHTRLTLHLAIPLLASLTWAGLDQASARDRSEPGQPVTDCNALCRRWMSLGEAAAPPSVAHPPAADVAIDLHPSGTVQPAASIASHRVATVAPRSPQPAPVIASKVARVIVKVATIKPLQDTRPAPQADHPVQTVGPAPEPMRVASVEPEARPRPTLAVAVEPPRPARASIHRPALPIAATLPTVSAPVAVAVPAAPVRPVLIMPPAFDVIAAVLLTPRADLR